MTTTRRTTTTKRKKPAAKKPVLQSQTFQKAVKSYEEAQKVFSKGDYGKAIRLFETVVENFRTEREISDRARIRLSVARARQKGEAPTPTDAEEMYYRGVLAANDARFDEAEEMYQRVLKKEPENDKALYALAALSGVKGDASTACAHLAKAIEINNTNRIYALNDDDFESVREDDQFIALLGQSPGGDA